MPNSPSVPPFQPAPQPVDELALAEIKSAILAKLTLAIGKDADVAVFNDDFTAWKVFVRGEEFTR